MAHTVLLCNISPGQSLSGGLKLSEELYERCPCGDPLETTSTGWAM